MVNKNHAVIFSCDTLDIFTGLKSNKAVKTQRCGIKR